MGRRTDNNMLDSMHYAAGGNGRRGCVAMNLAEARQALAEAPVCPTYHTRMLVDACRSRWQRHLCPGCDRGKTLARGELSPLSTAQLEGQTFWAGSLPAKVPHRKPKLCANPDCRQSFRPRTGTQVYCTQQCGYTYRDRLKRSRASA